MLFKMLRIFITLALLAAVQCRFGGGFFHSDYYYEGESESESESESSESSSESSSETSSEPPPCPCTPLEVGQCCDDCHYCKDENAICDTYGYSKVCVCKDGFIFDYKCKKCVPDNGPLTTETTHTTPTTPQTTTPQTPTPQTTPPCPFCYAISRLDGSCIRMRYGVACQADPDSCCVLDGLKCIDGICRCSNPDINYDPFEEKCCGSELGETCCLKAGFDQCKIRDSNSICDLNKNSTCVCSMNTTPTNGFCM
ncbi:cadmium metallothionein-like [Mya arenaria]|uniref:cadmium metallothionein-like n=1 Tax=Mya arenaria TaxID=6604 RepID=UPI0022E11481|nr:cadmium metallothionein-like [Mya arenaria]XP_052765735.1 cadmium metallothionein-like [Mya arenaria]